MFSVVDLPAFQAILGPSKGTKTKGSNQKPQGVAENIASTHRTLQVAQVPCFFGTKK